MPTASAVVSDLIGVALGTTPAMFRQLNVYMDRTGAANVLPFDELQSRYYLRLAAKDQPGVMAAVSTILGNAGISLSAILQPESEEGGAIPIVVTTHIAREGSMQAAIRQINALPVTAGFANRLSTSLNGLNTQNGIDQTIVINVTSGFQVSSKINITDADGTASLLYSELILLPDSKYVGRLVATGR